MALVAATLAGSTAYLDAKFHFRKDLASLYRLHSATRQLAKAASQKRASCYYLFERSALTYPTATCLWSRDGVYTWRETYDHACQYGAYFLSLGLRPGDLVALYLQNVPEFIFAWLGLWAIGCAPAMINWNLSGDALLHCLRIAEVKFMLVDAEEGCRARVEGERERVEGELGIKLLFLTEGLKREIAGRKAERLGDEYREGVTGESPICLFFTSGTTGLPKGVPFTMQRTYIGAALDTTVLGSRYSSRSGPNGDRWYDCMPLYHGTGGVVAMLALLTGVSVALGRRFSARNFWPDIHASGSTFFVYVGETARYLLAAPPSALDTTHRIRCIFGNGMRPDVWTRFQTRFAISEIAEFFSSTEGLFSTSNYSRNGFAAHAVGHHGLLLRLLTHSTYIPVATDPLTGRLARFPPLHRAVRLPYAAGGELLVRLPAPAAFPGYHRAPAATAAKLAHDVFAPGDLYYRTGDALRRDRDGRWFFQDRLADSFRWKAENVATAEVAQALGAYPGVREANVYGVLVPGHEGRAGCAALLLDDEEEGGAGVGVRVDWTALARFATERLPRYAVPVFVRVVRGRGMGTHNHKQDKVALREEGVEPGRRGTKVVGGERDRVLWLERGGLGYVEFGEGEWNRLVAGEARL